VVQEAAAADAAAANAVAADAAAAYSEQEPAAAAAASQAVDWDHSYLAEDWYYLDEEQVQVGPNSVWELESRFNVGDITPATLMWRPGQESWYALSDMAYLLERLLESS